MPPRLLQYILIGVMAAALAGVVLASGGSAAIQRRIVAPPSFDLSFGSLRVRAFQTNIPDCRTPGGVGVPNSSCVSQSALAPDEYFAVWLLERSFIRGVPIERAHRLFIMRLDERR
jgi:hypothetical protein